MKQYKRLWNKTMRMLVCDCCGMLDQVIGEKIQQELKSLYLIDVLILVPLAVLWPKSGLEVEIY